ncbi:MAG: amino acid racemase [Candidatus Kaiserbacteria bacterium]|nr:amino acid racemase [Candidatus Kaiserbacteria bacterium]
MNQSKKTIGILGGMGPEASAYFYNLLIKLAHKKYGAVQDTDFPPILIYNLTLFGFDETGITDEDLVKKQLIEGVKKLELAGSDFIIIACNTVHIFYDAMQNAVNIPILNIIDETVDETVRKGYMSVGLLSSESTNKMGLYKNKLEDRGIKVFSVSDEQQEKLNKIILHVMAGEQGVSDVAVATKIIDNLISQGAEAIILGCTELPLAIDQAHVSIPLFNSNEIVMDRALSVAFTQ